MSEHPSRPRLLVTGFGPFPGAPRNPTEWLVPRLRERLEGDMALAAFRADVLDVDYATVGPRLAAIGSEFRPDIAIHFGLAQECRGFRLERTARNRHQPRPDNAGRTPEAERICEAPETLASTLPLEEIAAALEAAGLPVEWSDDAGGYLCNMVFMLSRAGACPGFSPPVSGFVHVPLLAGDAGGGGALEPEDLLRGALATIAVCAATWPRRAGSG